MISNPCLRNFSIVGVINLISSLPKVPFSPACGFNPAIAIRGFFMPKYLLSASCVTFTVLLINSSVNDLVTSFKAT